MFRIFFFNAPAPTEIYTLSLHDALPIFWVPARAAQLVVVGVVVSATPAVGSSVVITTAPVLTANAATRSRPRPMVARSEEHTSELQSRQYFVCRPLLEKKQSSTCKIILN